MYGCRKCAYLHGIFRPARSYAVNLRRLLVITAALGLAAALAPGALAGGALPQTEFLVTLKAPSLANALASSRVLSARAKHARLDVRAPTSASYLRALAAAQRTFQRRLASAVPSASVRWHYGIVLNGISVVASPRDAPRLASLPGVARVYPSIRYHALEQEGYQVVGAPELWGPSLTTAGQGEKIGVIDDGVDQTHPYLSSAGFSMPPGFPRGNTHYTTSKVIVARAFAPPRPKWRYAHLPFDPALSEHGTHVAGIAAGDYDTNAFGTRISGVAPKAYIGNYKVLSIPTVSGVGPDGNAPEIVAGIEAAVRDGMNVINLSLGEPEVEPRRDPVVKAVDGAAQAGVVPAIAAGNDFSPFGVGSIDSPGSAPRAITAAASTRDGVIAGFSSSGPTPVSRRMKPDVSAPGVDILSSVPRSDGTWARWAGTSMASPHVAGAAALLRQRHPIWTVAQIKSALVQTGRPVYEGPGHAAEVPPTREGGGMLDLPRADTPLLFAQPADVSFGCLRAGMRVSRTITLMDAGGGSGVWTVTGQRIGSAPVHLQHPSEVTVPGRLGVTASHVPPGTQGSGFILLTRGTVTRRIPFWYCNSPRKLRRHGYSVLRRTGSYAGNTKHRKALVSRYRYPQLEANSGIPTVLRGPEQVFRVRVRGRIANFGVAILSQARGAQIQARIVQGGDENRMTGYPSLPLNLNPYLAQFLGGVRAASAVLPGRGTYDVVFDSTSRADAGKFRFRFWVNDTTPPRLALRTRTVRSGGTLRIRATDAGSGIEPDLTSVRVDRTQTFGFRYSRRRGTISLPLNGIARGTHRLRVQVSDYEESRNMEDVGPILPNTRVLHASFRVR